MNKDNIKKSKFLAAIAICSLLTLVIGATYAYFAAQVSPGANADVDVATHTTDSMVFSSFSPIVLGPVTQANFGSGEGNKSGTTSGTVLLKANAEADATYCYDAYIKILSNDFVYTTDNNTPEIIVSASKNGVELLTNADITTLRTNQTLPIPTVNGGNSNKHSITALAGDTFSDNWSVTATFVNLATDQSNMEGENNTNKTFQATVYFVENDC